jgi:uncharacterized repeat protein (TIGR01451 family)
MDLSDLGPALVSHRHDRESRAYGRKGSAPRLTRSARGHRSLVGRLLAGVGVAAVLALVAEPARADTFTVTWAASDIEDSNPGDGRCMNRGGGGYCSLRAAIEEANASPAADVIAFNLPLPLGDAVPIPIGTGGYGELEPIRFPLTIDGTTQPGYVGTPIVALDGGPRNLAWGLMVTGGSSFIRGLIIRNFGSVVGGDVPTEGGIVLTGGDGNTVTGNFIGTDDRGLSAQPNASGVLVQDSARNVIGGPTALSGNLISGNHAVGVVVSGAGAIGNQVVGNRIGTDRTGEAALGNGSSGVLVTKQVFGGPASDTVIGGTAAGEGNLISGNGRDGIQIVEAPNNQIRGNLIGTDRTGKALLRSDSGPVGNRRDGVAILTEPGFAAVKTIVGGETASARNVISGNGHDGVRIAGARASDHKVKGNLIGTDVDGQPTLGNSENGVSVVEGAFKVVVGCKVRSSSTDCSKAANTIAGNGRGGVFVSGANAHNVTVRANQIFKNGPDGGRQLTSGLGIDLDAPGREGVTANDTGDGDRGPNELMNFPVGVRATSDPRTGTTISGLVDTPAPRNVRVDLYVSNEVAARPAFGEGGQWIGSVKPSPSGSFSSALPASTATRGKFFSATATSPEGSTSEFSPVCGDPDRDGSTDSDGDALCDDWERYGIDFNGDSKVDLPLQKRPYRADWERKDLFVEIDYMASSATSAEPQEAALDMVRKAFAGAPVGSGAKRGINLHLSPDGQRPGLTDERVDLVPSPFFHGNPGPNGPDDPDDLWDIKLRDPAKPCDGSFGTVMDITGKNEVNCANRLGARRLVFRYALFGHSRRDGREAEDLPLGAAFFRDNDLLVTVGFLRADQLQDTLFLLGGSGGIAPQCARDVAMCSANVEAGVLMHELGHTLGLRHGGGDDVDFKPNYLSVMNDTFANQEIVPDRPLDYSRCRFGLLNETRLEEQKGIFHGASPDCPPAGDLAGLRTAFSFPSPSGACQMKLVPAVGPIDWNQRNGIEASPVETGIDEPPEVDSCQTPDDRDLQGFDDWDNISYAFLDSEELDPSAEAEPALSLAQALAAARATDADGDGVSNLTDNCNVIGNPGQADSDRDGIGDACAARITDVNLAVTQSARPKRARIGDRVTYSITVTNDWPLAAPGTAITVTLPDGVHVREATASQGAFAAGSGVWSVGTLAKRGRATLTLKADVVAPGRLVSVAEVSASHRPDRNSIPANGDPLEDDHARAVVRGAAPGVGSIRTLSGAWTGPTPAERTPQEPAAVAVHGSTLYVADARANQVKAVDLTRGTETLVAGNGTRGGAGDGGPARAAQLAFRQDLRDNAGLAVDAAGNLIIADTDSHRVRKVGPGGKIATIAGTGARGLSGDGGSARAARLNEPRGLALDRRGNLYVADSGNQRVRKIDGAGNISTVVRMTTRPTSVAVRPSGNLLVTPGPQGSFASGSVLEVDPSGATSIFAGGGGSHADGVPARSAYLYGPVHVAVDPTGNVYITDNDELRVRVVDATGTISTWAGTYPPPFSESNGVFSGDFRSATRAELARPVGVAFDAAGNGYIADRGNHRVRRVGTDGIISTVAGNGSCCVSGKEEPPLQAQTNKDDGPAASAQLGQPGGLAVDAIGNIAFVDQNNHSFHTIDPAGRLSRLAGRHRRNCTCPPRPPIGAKSRVLDTPSAVATGAPGTTYFDDRDKSRQAFVYRADYNPQLRDAQPRLTHIAGNGELIGVGDGGKALEEALFGPLGLALDPAGNLYIAEAGGHRVRRIDRQGIISTVAGTGVEGNAGDGNDGKRARLRSPEDVEVARDGTVYVADTGNHRVRRIDASGTITTVAGSGKKGFSGDGGRAVAARLNQPSDIALDAHGNLYIADRGNHRLRLVTAAGIILTIAGTGSRRVGGDRGLPTGAPLASPDGVALDHRQQLLVSTGRLIRRLKVPSGPALYISDVRVRERTGRDRAAKLTVTLLEPARSQVSVRFTTVDRTAKAPTDYAATSGALSFGPGEMSKRIELPIVGDGVREKRERLEVALSETSGGADLADLVGQVSISDDD